MAIFAIGDMHLSLGTDKPMDVFPGWEGYLPRLEANWRKLIGPDDTVILAGDTSWAMNLNDTKADFAFIEMDFQPYLRYIAPILEIPFWESAEQRTGREAILSCFLCFSAKYGDNAA